MAKVDINTIKNWFRTTMKPTQAQFWDTWDSFWHKDEKIQITSVDGLDDLIAGKADSDVLLNHLQDPKAHGIDAKVDKEAGKGLSTEDFTTDLRDKLENLDNFDPTELYDRLDQLEDADEKLSTTGGVMTGSLTLAVGTSSEASLFIPQGELTAVPQPGAIEKDASGTLYSTSASGERFPVKFDQVPIRVVNTNVTLDNSYRNAIVRITADCTITIPAGLLEDFNCVFDADGSMSTFVVESSDITLSAPNGVVLPEEAMCTLYRRGSGYRLNGSLI